MEGVEYHEVWERVPESVGPCWALRLRDGDGAAPRLAFLLVAGDCFMFVADRPRGVQLPAVPSAEALSASRLAEALAALLSLDDKRAALQFEASFGRVAAGEAAPAWRIELSTLPGRAGGVLLPPGSATGCDALLEAAGATLAVGAYAPPGGWHVTRDQ